MNKRTIVIVLGRLCLFLMLSTGAIQAQTPAVYNFSPSPYPTSITETLADDQINLSAVEAVLKLERSGKPSVHLAFLSDRFYLFYDLTGLKQVYLFDYKDTLKGYQIELSLSGISLAEMSAVELVNCILKYHNRT